MNMNAHVADECRCNAGTPHLPTVEVRHAGDKAWAVRNSSLQHSECGVKKEGQGQDCSDDERWLAMEKKV
jgi:hypothetical protein